MGKKELTIDLRSGETPDQAIARISKEMKGSQSPSKSKGKRASRVTVSDPMAGSPVESEVWMASHVYMRPGQTSAMVRTAATMERRNRGPSVLVFCHEHQFGEACVAACKERVLDGE